MESTLPVRRIVLYTHGVGHFERRANVEGQKIFKLFFKKEEMHDILNHLLYSVPGMDR
jgi:hypothetical protein